MSEAAFEVEIGLPDAPALGRQSLTVVVCPDLVCAECGGALEWSQKEKFGSPIPDEYLRVEPCKECMKGADEDGYARGLTDGENGRG